MSTLIAIWIIAGLVAALFVASSNRSTIRGSGNRFSSRNRNGSIDHTSPLLDRRRPDAPRTLI
jgi:hypothetical protein